MNNAADKSKQVVSVNKTRMIRAFKGLILSILVEVAAIQI